MLKKTIVASVGILAMASVPLVSLAQTAGNNTPSGSKQNPIKPASATSSPKGGSSANGKRGSKTNPITGSVHSRTSN